MCPFIPFRSGITVCAAVRSFWPKAATAIENWASVESAASDALSKAGPTGVVIRWLFVSFGSL